MSKSELKPCPFCGGEPYGIKYEYDSGDHGSAYKYLILCTRCFAMSGRHPSETEAIAAWNRRVNNDND